MDNKLKHLELIQGVINRMASNSFKLKGWAVTLASGIFAWQVKNQIKCIFLLLMYRLLFFGF